MSIKYIICAMFLLPEFKKKRLLQFQYLSVARILENPRYLWHWEFPSSSLVCEYIRHSGASCGWNICPFYSISSAPQISDALCLCTCSKQVFCISWCALLVENEKRICNNFSMTIDNNSKEQNICLCETKTSFMGDLLLKHIFMKGGS